MRARNLLINITIALAALLVFLLVFENRVVLPAWLQVGGRMHPLVLHFPIALLVLYCGILLFVPETQYREGALKPVTEWILVLTAFTSTCTALFGLFLSRESGYDAEALFWHKWSGVVLGLLPLGLYFLRERLSGVLKYTGSIAALLVVLFAGHQGAGITHGQNFLLAPMLPEKANPVVPIEEAEVYAHLVKPILDAKCMSCHNEKKAKGELIMTTEELLLKGGKSGKLWDSTAPDLGLLLQRLHLPLEQKKHMPPQGKPQLEDEEIAILYYWIRSGASFTRKVLSFGTSDSLRLLAEQQLSTPTGGPVYDFARASESKLKSLNNANRVVNEIALESPAVSVTFYNAQEYSQKALDELLAIKDNIVQLELSRMPVKDEALSTIAQFSNLEKLNLNFTGISGAGLDKLQGLKKLHTLSLAGTPVKKDQLAPLEKIGSLKRVVIWNTGLTVAELEDLKKQKGPLVYETGFRSDTLVMQLTPPILQNEEQVLTSAVPLKMKHYINGAQIRYTLDGTEPDSLKSPLYDGKALLEGNLQLKARAFKPGWISSETVTQYFFRTTYRPDSAQFITKPDPKFASQGPKSLFNGIKGEAVNFAGGQWLGYRENKMESLLYFGKPVNLQSVTFSCLNLISSYIMPPYAVEVWAGPDAAHLKLVGKLSPKQPEKYESPTIQAVEVKFAPVQAAVVKLVAVPVPALPKWHQGKGEKGWVFVDEVFLN